jgi:hypothetical protein
MDLATVATHEAGHAVMHAFLRLDNLDAVSVIPKPLEGRPGYVSAGRIEVRSLSLAMVAGARGRRTKAVRVHRIICRKQLLVVLAGPIAAGQRIGGTDRQHAQLIAETLAGAKGAKRMRERSRRMAVRLVRGPLSPAISSFAEILRKRGEIDRWEAREILCRLLGIDPDAYWRL